MLEVARNALEMVIFGQVLAHLLRKTVLLSGFLGGPWVISVKVSLLS